MKQVKLIKLINGDKSVSIPVDTEVKDIEELRIEIHKVTGCRVNFIYEEEECEKVEQ